MVRVVADHIARWLRDEEAAGSNPATPTQLTGHLRSMRVAFFTPYSRKVQQRLRAKLSPQPLECVARLAKDAA